MTKKKQNSLAKTENNGSQIVKVDASFGEVYFKVQNGNIMRPIKSKMLLTQSLGQLYYVSKKYNITSDGYKHLNKVASISMVNPQSVVVDGKEQPNPYIERHERTKITKAVYIRKIGIGHSPAGNITVIDKTLHYNLYTYFIQSIQAKMNKKKWENRKQTDELEHPGCAELGVKDKEPTKKGKWVWYELEDPLGIWANYEDSAIISCMEEHTQKQRFADRIAQTIVERNILKDHPAIGISQVEPTNKTSPQDQRAEALVTVYGYRNDFNAPKINDILARAERGDETLEVKEETIKEIEPEEEETEAKKVIEDEKNIEDQNFELSQEQDKEQENK